MTDIVSQVQRVTDIIGEISAAASEQTTGIGQVNDAVTQLDQVTQQNAALVEESAAAADSLKLQAANLVEAVRGVQARPERPHAPACNAHRSPSRPAARRRPRRPALPSQGEARGGRTPAAPAVKTVTAAATTIGLSFEPEAADIPLIHPPAHGDIP